MAIKKPYMRWLLAAIVLIALILIAEYFVNRNRQQLKMQEKNTNEQGVLK